MQNFAGTWSLACSCCLGGAHASWVQLWGHCQGAARRLTGCSNRRAARGVAVGAATGVFRIRHRVGARGFAWVGHRAGARVDARGAARGSRASLGRKSPGGAAALGREGCRLLLPSALGLAPAALGPAPLALFLADPGSAPLLDQDRCCLPTFVLSRAVGAGASSQLL